jgi:hypothetical protein
MRIKDWVKTEDQSCVLGRHEWRVSRLFELSRNLPVMDVPLKHLNVYYLYSKLTLREMVTHMQAVERADLAFPIILDEDGEIMDGRHRVMKAMMTGAETIKAVRFETNPYPDKVNDAS